MESEYCIDENVSLHVYPSDYTVEDVIMNKIEANDRNDKEDPFFVVNLGRVEYLYSHWQKLLPSVDPFYAVKCNYDPVLLRTLAALGAGFDCCSEQEINTILNLGVDPSRIIYANPCKQNSHIRFAAKVGVKLMTFDDELELPKVKELFPTAELVLRIFVDDSTANARQPLGEKFGAEPSDVPHLLLVAKELNLNVVGVSFHVGHGVKYAVAYANALALAKDTFVLAEEAGFKMKLLDIGGGYPGLSHLDSLFKEMADTINLSLTSLFSSYKDLKIIAEPGNYFACSSHVLAVNVISKKCRTIGSDKKFMYYINDGAYGSLNEFHRANLIPKLPKDSKDAGLYASTVWGPTMDSTDKVNENVLLPELNVGDWLYYEHVGAYTVCFQTMLCGFPHPVAYYYCTDKESKVLLKSLGLSKRSNLAIDDHHTKVKN
ncbi:ornithine decarboxylase-like isoform X2 [Dysidea avara]|uniref:ornithine decarboxylase-like isoform X2 n=1 Tax=Dysidea avara TaxID=196820 RepID=UPI003316B61C